MHTQEEFDYALSMFVAGCEHITNGEDFKNYTLLSYYIKYEVQVLKKYIRIVRREINKATNEPEHVGGSVHCFVDKATGDVLKAASYKTPAKGVRGNIFDEKNGLGRMNQYGPEYNK